MELLTSLPPDLAAFADPSVRGAAPLLRPPDGDAAPGTAAIPFELCLALLTGGPVGGESWPATGKELPALPLESAAGELDRAALLAVVPTPLADAMLQSRLPLAPPPLPDAALPVLPPLPQAPAASAPPLPNMETAAAAGAATPQTNLDPFDPLAALANADAAALPLDGGDQQPATAGANTAPQPSWLEAFTNERRLQRPPAATTPDTRAAAESTSVLAAPQPSSATAAVVEATPGAQSGTRRVELQKVLVSAVPAADSTSPPDWLPQAASQAAPTGGTALASTAAAAAPQAPVDVRSPGWQEAFASRVQVLVDTKVGEAHIKLNPPELGAVDVKISVVDDQTFVQLTTATAAARDELAHSLPRLRELFTMSGLELGGASVHNGRDGYPAGQGHGSGGDTAARSSPLAAFGADGTDEFDAPALSPRRSLGRIDTFA